MFCGKLHKPSRFLPSGTRLKPSHGDGQWFHASIQGGVEQTMWRGSNQWSFLVPSTRWLGNHITTYYKRERLKQPTVDRSNLWTFKRCKTGGNTTWRKRSNKLIDLEIDAWFFELCPVKVARFWFLPGREVNSRNVQGQFWVNGQANQERKYLL